MRKSRGESKSSCEMSENGCNGKGRTRGGTKDTSTHRSKSYRSREGLPPSGSGDAGGGVGGRAGVREGGTGTGEVRHSVQHQSQARTYRKFLRLIE